MSEDAEAGHIPKPANAKKINLLDAPGGIFIRG
jgi:hypothetical protein